MSNTKDKIASDLTVMIAQTDKRKLFRKRCIECLTEAIEHDLKSNLSEALKSYEKGIMLFVVLYKYENDNDNKAKIITAFYYYTARYQELKEGNTKGTIPKKPQLSDLDKNAAPDSKSVV